MLNSTYAYQSKTVFYKGCVFDSLLELRYALMIEETHAWLRDGIEIYHGVNVQSSGTKQKLHCYRPDFLVRNLTTGIAELVEIKPDGFSLDSQKRRARIVAKYTKRFAYDWMFRLVNESEITLSTSQWLQYKNILSTQKDWHHQPCLKLLQNNTTFSDAEYQQFVVMGLVPAIVP
jgi:hypothetical protein